MNHLLNNPVWTALNTGNSNLGEGNDKAKHFFPDISLFVGLEENRRENYEALLDIIPHDHTIAAFAIEKNVDPAPWTLVHRVECLQMIFEGPTPKSEDNPDIVKLNTEHIPAMLALTKLAPPGPFLQRTIEFGGYEGIFSGDELIAMGGQRLHCGPFVEISAICTHPNHNGKGYARQIINSQIRRLLAEDNIPYLHVRADNARAINIYSSMGFVKRTEVTISILKKP